MRGFAQHRGGVRDVRISESTDFLYIELRCQLEVWETICKVDALTLHKEILEIMTLKTVYVVIEIGCIECKKNSEVLFVSENGNEATEVFDRLTQKETNRGFQRDDPKTILLSADYNQRKIELHKWEAEDD